MLAYNLINLIIMLTKYELLGIVKVATDSIYIQKTALHKFTGIMAYVVSRLCGKELCGLIGKPQVGPAQWCNKGKQLYTPKEHM